MHNRLISSKRSVQIAGPGRLTPGSGCQLRRSHVRTRHAVCRGLPGHWVHWAAEPAAQGPLRTQSPPTLNLHPDQPCFMPKAVHTGNVQISYVNMVCIARPVIAFPLSCMTKPRHDLRDLDAMVRHEQSERLAHGSHKHTLLVMSALRRQKAVRVVS